AERGLTPVVAVELEFYLLDARLGPDGRPQTSINPRTGQRNRTTQVYYMEDLNDYQAFTDAVSEACRAQDIPADTAVAEYAPGQFEINLRHRKDALRACDDAIMLKRVIKAVAGRQGMLASFMAKPFVDQAGSGAHIHVSLLDEAGNNVFACSPDAPAETLRRAIAGLQRSSRDCMLMFAPHANSYRRFVLNAFVPLNDAWGFNNRTVAMRIPHSDPANLRIEHRIAGADANPYLVTAAVLAGILDGLEHPGDPGAPTVGNAYEQSEHRELYWRDTIRDFMASDFVARHFGSEFRHIYGQQKLKEMRSFNTEVTTLEIDWYLRQVGGMALRRPDEHVDSWYARSAVPAPERPRLEGRVTADVAILGGGLTGLSAALELAEAGLRVVLLEARRIGWGASGRNGGQVIFGYSCDQAKIEALVGREDARRMFDWSVEAVDLVRQRIARHGIAADWRNGHAHVAIKPRHITALKAWQRDLEENYGYPLQWWDREQLREVLDSPRYLGGLYDPRSGHLHPLNYTLGIAAAAERAGALLFERTEVTKLERGAKPVLRTAHGEVQADFVVLAGNAIVHGIAPELDDKIMPVGTYVGATPPLGEELARQLIRNDMAVADINWALDYFRFSADHRLLFGGRASYST